MQCATRSQWSGRPRSDGELSMRPWIWYLAMVLWLVPGGASVVLSSNWRGPSRPFH
jgi:hypothetical protein